MLNVRMNSVNEAQIHTEELDERTVCICVYIYIYILRQKNRLYKRLTRFISRKEKRKTEIRKIFPMFTRKKKKKENKTLARQPKCKYPRHSPLSKFKKPFSRPSPRLILNYEHLAFSHSTEATCTRI